MPPPRQFVPLKIVPPGDIASTEQLMAIARGLEHEAGQRYRDLALRMHLQGEEALASLFIFLANIEEKHATELDARAMALIGHVPDPAALTWNLPENFDEEDARSAGLSPYRALAIAVRNEERAFAFYSYIAAYAATPELQRVAEHLAVDELAHASLLRRERRTAWRTETTPVAQFDATPESVPTLLAEAVSMERAAAAAHRALAVYLCATENPEAASLFDAAADDEEALARTLAGRLPTGTAYREHTLHADSMRKGVKLLEFAFDRYSQIAARATVESVMLEAQTLTEHALRRLALVGGALDAPLVT
jgi:rubrerythrin